MDTINKAMEATVQDVATDDPNGSFELILSTDGLDRDNEHLWASEWAELPARCHIDSDHAFSQGKSVPLTVGSGVPEITENGDLVVRGTYASTPHAQLVRQLVGEKHVWQGSVSYQEHKDDDGNISRELLNGTITGVPSNPNAVIMASKAADKKPYGDVAYADPKNGKYPIDTAERTRAAWSYINQAKNAAEYSAKELAAIKGRIRSAARKFGIEIADAKALLVALCKAIGDGQDLGASSIYDDDTNDQADDPGEDDESDSEDALAQAVHDAACALGAACSKSITLPSGVQLMPNGEVLPPAADKAAGVATDKVPTPPVVSPADLAARALVRKFHLDQSLIESDVY